MPSLTSPTPFTVAIAFAVALYPCSCSCSSPYPFLFFPRPFLSILLRVEGPLSKARLFVTDVGDSPDHVRQAFAQLMVGVKELVLARRENEENQMLGMQ